MFRINPEHPHIEHNAGMGVIGAGSEIDRG